MNSKERIKSVRQKKGLTQIKLAILADVSVSTIQRIERGANVGSHYIEKVENVLNISNYS